MKMNDLENLRTIKLISNFNWPTDNEVKRVIISLDIKTGEFSFLNGFASQELRAKLSKPIEGEKKLILFTRKRNSSNAGSLNSDDPMIQKFENESYFYNRFILGYEVSGKGKMAIMVLPNGNIEEFNS